MADGRRLLSYREQREWEQMEGRILAAERRLEDCRQAATEPAVASDHMELSERLAELAAVQAEVDSLYARWAELEAKVTA
jgi:ATP-binding cassette subfamily F protein uup